MAPQQHISGSGLGQFSRRWWNLTSVESKIMVQASCKEVWTFDIANGCFYFLYFIVLQNEYISLTICQSVWSMLCWFVGHEEIKQLSVSSVFHREWKENDDSPVQSEQDFAQFLMQFLLKALRICLVGIGFILNYFEYEQCQFCGS